ncbi:M48 family metalloprotease [Granulicella mallensis]|uniref:Peptidase M48 Ste24p n=1 Tax=Granulicella mallensis (strain ATCC BAA-1857 / DSM 23137 / MP5ACTX8) TaxID=682795 RepID=G8NZM6_GRAMM|nr:M48 family metalloprotease [Granulicella mallensis]AEU39146.1 peptidase M48 Ste24p [Granulicella mallensis MP5ACTX8]
MRRWLPLSLIVIAGIFAIVAVQWQRIAARPSAQGILSAAADAQHEATRVPTHFDPMSDADEIALGDELASEYAERWPSSPADAAKNRAIEAYLQIVGERAAAGVRRKLPWKFHYIPDPAFVNAFALPGGHVFVGQGVIVLMKSEDALAAVLGHEVEHIDLRHCAERMQTEAHLRELGTLGAVVGLPVEVFLAGYSKEQEMEADRDGTTLAVKAGYSPQGILQLLGEFEKLEQQANASDDKPATPVDEAAQVSLQTVAGYFRSHPPAAQREQQVRELMRSQRWPTPPLRKLQTF